VLGAARNRRAARIVDDLRRATWLLGSRTTDARSLTDIAAEHAPVVEAIVNGDPAAAAATMSLHLSRTGRLLVAQALGCAPDDPPVDAVWLAPPFPHSRRGGRLEASGQGPQFGDQLG
jgi:DNA-binding GntR family transcriptional regulator